VGSNERIVRANGVDLCVETFGDPADPPILLIGGAAASMDWWEDEFCQQLAIGSRFIIRYDSRDTGRSVNYPAGAPAYSLADLVEDAVGLLAALGLRAAHVVGISMGGGIGQRLAVDHPDRVASLTLISTSPAGPGGPANPDLPPMSDRLQAHFAAPPPEPDWSDRAAVIDHIVEGARTFAGELQFEEERVRELAGRIVDRTGNIASSMTNHWLIDGGQAVRHRLGQITAPMLVMHGTDDPLFPYGHAEALATEIPGARLIPLAGVGHQVPPRPVWDIAVPAILRHTSGGWEEQADRLAARSLAAGDPTGWFEHLYAAGRHGEVAMPWDRDQPHRMLVQWARDRDLSGARQRALVVGCGLGADGEYLTALGFDTVAFDISETAIRIARSRFPDSPVRYVVADLLDPPSAWREAFDLVVEIYTVQALPDPPRRNAITNITGMVAPGGTLIVLAAAHNDVQPRPQGPPWPLTRAEIDAFADGDLSPAAVENVQDPDDPTVHRWLAEFHHPLPQL
jgi:pimeloyl-ACP methyl ester carboxylesterase/SAM-dependent methyltransferase